MAGVAKFGAISPKYALCPIALHQAAHLAPFSLALFLIIEAEKQIRLRL
jgi:hypothetical protein